MINAVGSSPNPSTLNSSPTPSMTGSSDFPVLEDHQASTPRNEISSQATSQQDSTQFTSPTPTSNFTSSNSENNDFFANPSATISNPALSQIQSNQSSQERSFSNHSPLLNTTSHPHDSQTSNSNLGDDLSNIDSAESNNRPMPSRKNNSLKFLLGGALVFFLVIAVGAGLYLMQMSQDTRNQAWVGEEIVDQNVQNIIANDGSFQGFVERKNDMIIGNVTLTTEDLKNRFILFYPDTPEYTDNLSNWRTVAEKLVKEASVQDYASKEGVLPNSPQRFNPSEVNKAIEYFETLGTNHISGEIITLWFYNTNPPEMGVERARQIQEGRIKQYHEKLTSGEMTMEQVAEEIQNTKEIGEIDPVWVGNTYSKFEFVNPDQKIFIDQKLTDYVWTLEKGQVSDVVVGQDFYAGEPYDAYFSIIKISSKETQKQADSVQDLKNSIQLQ